MNKVRFIANLIFSNDLHILTVTETWLSADVGTSFVGIPGFNFFRVDSPTGVRKHGVGVYISELIPAVPVEVVVSNVLVLYLAGLDLYVASVYRPPSNTVGDNELLLAFLGDFCFGRSILVLGDFNLPSLAWSPAGLGDGYVTPLDRQFFEVFSLVGLSQWVFEATFLQSGNILDLVLTSGDDSVYDLSTLPPMPGCQHVPVVFDFLAVESACRDREVKSRYKWYGGDFSAMNDELAVVDWDSMFYDLSVEDCYSLFCNTLSRLVATYVPVMECRLPRWQMPPPRSLMRRRAAAWRKFKCKRASLGRRHLSTEAALEDYLDLNRVYRSHDRVSQCNYEGNLAKKLPTCPKLFHSYIRRKKKGCSAVGPLKEGGVMLVEPGEIGESFADYFCDLFSSDCQGPLFSSVSEHQMSSVEITYDSVYSLLAALDPESAMGPDEVHPRVLKECAALLAYPLFVIFVRSLGGRVVPREWKLAYVVPLFKKGFKAIRLNYRPVNLTSVCCKTMERVLHRAMVQFMESFGILHCNQFGFRAGRSAEDQLLLTYGSISRWIDRGSMVDAVYLDFSRAFDTVPHRALLSKLSSMGFDRALIDWIGSFLDGRMFAVLVDGVESTWRPCSSGVPQGSVLGPLLFLIYVNNMMDGVGSFWTAYADDFKICTYFRNEDLSVQTTQLQQDIDRISRVGEEMNLKLNPSKCCVVGFGSGSGGRGDSRVPVVYSLGGVVLKRTRSSRDLGVVVDGGLRFHDHVSSIVGKAGGLMTNFLRSTVCRSKEFMTTLFVSNIRPLLDFCSPVWNVGYLVDVRKIEAVQRRWTREVEGLRGVEYGDRLRMLGLFSIRGRMLRADLIKVWKIFHVDLDERMVELFELPFEQRTRGHRFKLSVPVCRSEVGRRTFGVRCVGEWNALPAGVVEAESLESFKRRLDAHMAEEFCRVV